MTLTPTPKFFSLKKILVSLISSEKKNISIDKNQSLRFYSYHLLCTYENICIVYAQYKFYIYYYYYYYYYRYFTGVWTCNFYVHDPTKWDLGLATSDITSGTELEHSRDFWLSLEGCQTFLGYLWFTFIETEQDFYVKELYHLALPFAV